MSKEDEYTPVWEKLHLFVPGGRTLTFADVADFEENETTLQFSYRAKSDSYVKQARFRVAEILGYSYLEA